MTEEDRARSEMYAQEIERQRAEKQAASLEEFLEIPAARSAHRAHVAQGPGRAWRN